MAFSDDAVLKPFLDVFLDLLILKEVRMVR